MADGRARVDAHTRGFRDDLRSLGDTQCRHPHQIPRRGDMPGFKQYVPLVCFRCAEQPEKRLLYCCERERKIQASIEHEHGRTRRPFMENLYVGVERTAKTWIVYLNVSLQLSTTWMGEGVAAPAALSTNSRPPVAAGA